MPVLGVDVSDYQPAALPWAAWYAAGARVAVCRASVGFYIDPHFQRYVAEAYAAGFVVGAYHAILGHAYYDPARQAADFLHTTTSQIEFFVLDIEAPDVTAADVLAFVGYLADRIQAFPLYLYGNHLLAAIVAAHPELRRYAVWWAEYANKLPTTKPPYPAAKYPPADLNVIGWQFTGTGRLAPYASNIDLTTWYDLPGVLMPDPDAALRAGIGAQAEEILRLTRII